jgi:hypothetical protein
VSESDPSPSLTDVFDALQEASRTAAANGRVLYGPQAKKTLTTLFPDFSERTFGYKKFIELLRAGHDAGRFQLVTVNGHPHLVPAASAPTRRSREQGRLKADLWTTLVSWDIGLRYWDRKRRRAIFIPTDDEGVPLWDTSPADFVVVDPVPMQEQLEWMVDFANQQTAAEQARLLASLKDPAFGAFKRALGELNLSGAWRTRLRQRVTEHAADWAARHELPATSILEAEGRAPSRSVPHTPASAPPLSESDLERLRARMHRVIDQMNFNELSALQIPASYLLEP